MGTKPVFLSLADVLDIHRDEIEHYGGELGLRDRGLLESALAMPAAGIVGQYLHEDIYAMAAAYLFHIVKNHPFVDGNKRTGAMVAFVFLGLNGLSLNTREPPTSSWSCPWPRAAPARTRSPISSGAIR